MPGPLARRALAELVGTGLPQRERRGDRRRASGDHPRPGPRLGALTIARMLSNTFAGEGVPPTAATTSLRLSTAPGGQDDQGSP